MSATITKKIRIKAANDLLNSLFNGNKVYFYTSNPIPWDDENSSDVSTSAQEELNYTKRNLIFIKEITSDDKILCVKRFNWTSGITYTEANHDIEYTNVLNWKAYNAPFYVINSEENVYICISNNYDTPSTDEPTGQSTTYITTADGYIWKFLFDLKSSIKSKFLTNMWLPVPQGSNKTTIHENIENSAIDGDIPYIKVINKGSGYGVGTTITIEGDGSGAIAVPNVVGGEIISISMVNRGSGYTYANVRFQGSGSGATSKAMISPPGGHGSDAVYELGAFFVLFSATLIGDEDGTYPTVNTYRTVGIINDVKETSGSYTSVVKNNYLTTINISNISGSNIMNEKFIGETSGAFGYAFNVPASASEDLLLYAVEGTFTNGEIIHGQESNVNAIVDSCTYTTLDSKSGNILYKENIQFIARRDIQIETFKFAIEF